MMAPSAYFPVGNLATLSFPQITKNNQDNGIKR